MSEQTPLLSEQPSAPPKIIPGYQGGPPPNYQETPPVYGQSPQQPPDVYGHPGQPPQQPPPVVVVPTQQVVVTSVNFSDVPVSIHCPNCQNDVMTNLIYTPGALTWIIIGVLLLFGFWLGCCLIPLCIDGLKDVDHVCPVCNYQLGKYKRL